MKKRLRDLKPYLGSDYVVVKASPKLEKVWRGSPSEIVPKTFNRKLVVKRAPGTRVSTSGGILSLKRKLKAGTFESIPLPVSAHSLNDLKEWIETNPYYNDIMKNRDEVFNFKIFGNASYNNFGNLEALIDELEKYQNYDSEDENGDDWGDSESFYTNFELFRSYKDWKFPRDTPTYKARARQESKDRRRARKLANMTDAKREAYLERERELRNARRLAQPSYQAQKKAQRDKRASETKKQRAARLKKEKARDKKRNAEGRNKKYREQRKKDVAFVRSLKDKK